MSELESLIKREQDKVGRAEKIAALETNSGWPFMVEYITSIRDQAMKKLTEDITETETQRYRGEYAVAQRILNFIEKGKKEEADARRELARLEGLRS